MKYLFLRAPLLALLLAAAPAAFAQTAPNVGIGTPAPTQTLDVNGALRVRGPHRQPATACPWCCPTARWA